MESIRPGTELLLWRDSQGMVTKALVFAYQYRGYLAPYGEDRVSVNDIPLTTPVKTTEDGDVLVPLRAAAEALGMEVHWDSAKGAVVSYGEAMVQAPAPGEQRALYRHARRQDPDHQQPGLKMRSCTDLRDPAGRDLAET